MATGELYSMDLPQGIEVENLPCFFMQSELMIHAAAIVALVSYHVLTGLWHERYCQLTQSCYFSII